MAVVVGVGGTGDGGDAPLGAALEVDVVDVDACVDDIDLDALAGLIGVEVVGSEGQSALGYAR